MAQEQDAKWIKNTFAPNVRNKYFDEVTLFALLRAGFGFHNLSPKAQALVKSKLDAFKAARAGRPDPDRIAFGRKRPPVAK